MKEGPSPVHGWEDDLKWKTNSNGRRPQKEDDHQDGLKNGKMTFLKCADVDYYGTIYIKQGSIEKNRIFKILAGFTF